MMKKKVMFVLFLSLLILTTSAAPVYGWTSSLYTPYSSYIPVHYEHTKQWSMDKGFEWAEAKIIALNNENVDTLFKTNYKWHLDRHKFTGDDEDTRILQSKNEMIIAKRKINEMSKLQEQIKNTRSRWTKFKLSLKMKKAKQEALIYLGRSLHPIQDLYAHMDAGIDTPDDEIGLSHGMLDAPEVDVKILYENGETEIRKMNVETMTGKRNYSFYDDINYDFGDGQWEFKANRKKEDNSRWIKTRDATYELLDEFLEYAKEKNVKFN